MCLVLSALNALVTVFERGSQSCTVVLPVSAVAVEPGGLACAVEHEQTAAGLWREGAPEVLLSAGRAQRGVPPRSAAFRGVWRGVRRHDEERGWRLLDLLVGIVYAADQ